jgi:hypothetical protein
MKGENGANVGNSLGKSREKPTIVEKNLQNREKGAILDSCLRENDPF